MNTVKPEEPKKPVSPIVANAGGDDANLEIKLVHASSFDEVSEIADYIIEGCTVFLNLELLDPMQTRRMLDFLNGVTYSTDGEIKVAGKNTYLITPHNVDVSDENEEA